MCGSLWRWDVMARRAFFSSVTTFRGDVCEGRYRGDSVRFEDISPTRKKVVTLKQISVR